MENCEVKNCENLKGNGDSLFYVFCRIRWGFFLNKLGIAYNPNVTNREVQESLNQFRERGV